MRHMPTYRTRVVIPFLCAFGTVFACSGAEPAGSGPGAEDPAAKSDSAGDVPDATSAEGGGSPDVAAPDAFSDSTSLDATSLGDAQVGGDATLDADGAGATDGAAVDAAKDSALADAGDAWPQCADAGQKVCSKQCVPLDDPSTGCGANTCTACAIPNATAACSGGACRRDACIDKFLECNGVDSDGCEVDSLSDLAHCGGCDQLCRTFCKEGSCAPESPTAHLPDSQNALCTNGAAFVACPAAGQPYAGQDGNFTANKPTYAKIGGTVYDPVSGLMWEQAFAAGPFTRDEAKARCDELNKAPFAGYSDWRFPTPFEALTLVDSSRNLGLSPAVFSGQQQNTGIWTSGVEPGLALGYMLGLNWNVMILRSITQSSPASSLCVRGSLVNGGFTVAASGNVVVDSRTSLKWQRAMAPSTYTWAQALAYCSGLAIDGAGGYRLPSYKELWSIVDTTKASPAVDTALFPGTPTGSMWTSSPVTGNPNKAQVVETENGRANLFDQLQTASFPIRCVSGG